jgi:microcystin-dependent protein
MALQFIITDAGRAAIAQVGGAIGPVTLTKIAIGSAGYTPTPSRTSLQTEIKRLDPSGSSVPVPGTIHMTAQDDSADSYSVKEIGLYTNNGVLFAIYSQTGVILTKGSTASALFALDFVMTNVPAGTVVVGDAGFSYAQANETRLGVLAIATTAEAQAGTVDNKIITPLKLAQVTATESRRGVIALATTAEAQALAPDDTKAISVARLVDRTATTGRVGVVALATNAQTQTGTDATRAVTPASLASAASLFVPPGAVMPFASAVTPSGWLAANGNVVPNGIGTVQGITANFAALFAVVGTTYGAEGTLPDLRGYFVRGSGTNSDGTASGTFGQKQADAFNSHSHTGSTGAGGDHTHTASTNTAGNHSHGYSAPNSYQQDTTNSPANGKRATSNANLNTSAAGDHSHTVTIGAAGNHSHTVTIGAAGGTETRPKNIALLYCIKF